MIILMNHKNEQKQNTLISLKEVQTLLQASSAAQAVKWCQEKEIDFFRVGKIQVTYRFLIQVELDTQIIRYLKKKYPDNWKSFFNSYKNNDTYEFITQKENTIEENKTEKKQTSVKGLKGSIAKSSQIKSFLAEN